MPHRPSEEAAVLDTLDDAVRRAAAVAGRGGRRVVGIAGSPGAGKTTLAVALVTVLAERGVLATHVPMDGFHLADVELARLGRLDRKGAPDTFDAEGYAALLERVRASDDTVYAPAFDREIEQPIAGSVPVPPGDGLVVTEGNYLLLDDPRWRRARQAMDEVWFCDLDGESRRRRLVDRHVRFGKPEPAATAWVADVDEPNALLVEARRAAADVLVTARLPRG
jgi:pantothenate kinase